MSLDQVFRLLTVIAITLPLVGGLAGLGAWMVGNKIEERDQAAAAIQLKESKQELREAREEASDARQLAAELEENQKPRALTNNQVAALREALAKYPDIKSVKVAVLTTTHGDSDLYGRNIAKALQVIGLSVSYSMTISEYPPGITINPSKEHHVEFAQALISAFKEAGIDVKVYKAPKSSTPDNGIGLMIGLRAPKS